jgi:ParB-like chromosome segregation protein Spo0J
MMTGGFMTDWPADKVERRSVKTLVPYARNSRTHSDEQIAQIAASIKEWGWTTPVLVDEDGGIIAGHGRVLAAQRLGFDEVPCMVAAGWTEAQKRAYVIADNKLALNAGWDMEALKVELQDLDAAKFDLTLTGFELGELADIFAGVDPNAAEPEQALSENYSRKIEAPIYEITGDKPAVSQLIDRSKTDKLQAEIADADLPDDVRAFLHFAAERHTVFNFRNIAEFYAHSDAKTQDLMERSALVIIDFERAIEEGFVNLAQGMMEQVRNIKAQNNAA